VLEIYQGGLDVKSITNRWYDELRYKNYGAIIEFIGIVRDENNITGLSFDIYEPLLKKWFENWIQKAKQKSAIIYMAHSKGDVLLHESSFIALISSPKRRVSLEMIDEFVEDFKANAPIWKYDIINGEKIFAIDRATKIDGAGIFQD
jgi:molybdopterin synthase catalytic subunit